MNLTFIIIKYMSLLFTLTIVRTFRTQLSNPQCYSIRKVSQIYKTSALSMSTTLVKEPVKTKKTTKKKISDNDNNDENDTRKILVIVESPAKVKTIQKILDSNVYIVDSCVGHIRDLISSTKVLYILNTHIYNTV